jgi:hypothetical protein
MQMPPDLPVKEETIIPLAVQEAPDKWRRIAQEVGCQSMIPPLGGRASFLFATPPSRRLDH